MTGDRDPDARFKLVPTPEDKAVFHDMMDGGWKAIKSKYSFAFYQNGNLKFGVSPNAVRALEHFPIIEDRIRS